MTRVGQGVETKGTDTEHVAQAPTSPGVACCQWRQVGGSELLGMVLVLEQPSGQSYFKANHGSPVQSNSCSIAAQFLFLRGVGTH